ncbi:hypothetical protein LTR95_005958 [Oleoguttula sp. CCFEE 5521]
MHAIRRARVVLTAVQHGFRTPKASLLQRAHINSGSQQDPFQYDTLLRRCVTKIVRVRPAIPSKTSYNEIKEQPVQDWLFDLKTCMTKDEYDSMVQLVDDLVGQASDTTLAQAQKDVEAIARGDLEADEQAREESMDVDAQQIVQGWDATMTGQ